MAVTAVLQANVCGPVSYGISTLLSPALLPYAYVFPNQFLRFQWSFSYQILSHPFPYPTTCLAGLSSLCASVHTGRGQLSADASSPTMPHLLVTHMGNLYQEFTPLPTWDMKFQSSWGDREAATLLLNPVPPCRSHLLLTRTLSLLHQTHEKNK